ncbi:MAG: hypothetical protein HUU18_03360 [Phycisphaerales bacterium]|nr:hypothetical protein [Phycisphaerales bacterium]
MVRRLITNTILALSPALVGAVAAPAASCLLAGVASAQVADVAPYVVIADSATPMRGGASEHYYTITTLTPGTFLRVDADSPTWSRVTYPQGTGVFIRVEDVSVSGTTAKTVKAARIKAPQQTRGYAFSWTDASPAPIPEGTTLEIIEPVRETEGGPIVAYLVKAPDQARGYVETRLLRRATDTEAASFLEKLGLAKPKPPEEPAPEVKPSVPEVKPVVDLTQPVQPTEVAPVAPAPGQEAANPMGPAERPVGTVEGLESAFQRIWKEPAETAEIDELIAEYQRAIEASGSGDARRRTQLEQRVAALQIRKDVRERIRKAEEAKAALDADRIRLQEQLAAWERTRVYTLIGQLQPSTVYDGKRLPQMYRVVSVGGAAGRTLGYIRKTDEFDLDKYLGQVVGVVGQAQLDRSLQLNLITPFRVDRLKAADGGGLAPVGETPQTLGSPSAAPANPGDATRGTPGMGRRPDSPQPASEPEELPDGGQ